MLHTIFQVMCRSLNKQNAAHDARPTCVVVHKKKSYAIFAINFVSTFIVITLIITIKMTMKPYIQVFKKGDAGQEWLVHFPFLSHPDQIMVIIMLVLLLCYHETLMIFATWKALLRTIFLNVWRSIFHRVPSVIAYSSLSISSFSYLFPNKSGEGKTCTVAALGWL